MNDVLANLAATNLVSEHDLEGAFENGNPGSSSTNGEEADQIRMYESDWELETVDLLPAEECRAPEADFHAQE